MKLFSILEVAEHLCVTKRRVLKLVEEGRVKCTMVGSQWVVDEKELNRLKTTPRVNGRPNKR